MRKVLFTGSRDASPEMLAAVRKYIRDRLAGADVQVIVGDADGVDYEVIQACDEHEIPIEVHGARRIRHKTWTGKNIVHDTDYLGRDRIMAGLLEKTDFLVVVWNGKSRQCGTIYTAKQASPRVLEAYWLWKKWEQ